jgi:hypothetical protein
VLFVRKGSKSEGYGQLFSPDNEEELKLINTNLEVDVPYWTGWHQYSGVHGQWEDPGHTRELSANNEMWYPNQPNNKEYEDCAVYLHRTKGLHDIICTYKASFMCEYWFHPVSSFDAEAYAEYRGELSYTKRNDGMLYKYEKTYQKYALFTNALFQTWKEANNMCRMLGIVRGDDSGQLASPDNKIILDEINSELKIDFSYWTGWHQCSHHVPTDSWMDPGEKKILMKYNDKKFNIWRNDIWLGKCAMYFPEFEFDPEENGKVNDESCAEKARFVCEYELTSQTGNDGV